MLINKDYLSKFRLVFEEKTDNTLLQLFRYTFVGGFAFLIDFGTLFTLTEYFKIHYMVSAGIAFILGLTINYSFSVKWVFKSRVMVNRLLEFILFAIIGFVGLFLNELFLWILTDILAIYYLLSKIITTIIVYFWNFFARKILLFRKQQF
jgi:putative flippase GtrA